MLKKWFVIFCALLGAGLILPQWFPGLKEVAGEIPYIEWNVHYVHIMMVIIFGIGWNLKTE